MKNPLRYEVRVILGELIAALAVAMVLNFAKHPFILDLNLSTYVQGLISFNSGIIIALFVALFHSSDASIVAFRKFKLAASQVYTILIVNSILVCICALFLPLGEVGSEQVISSYMQLFGTLLATVGTGFNVYIIYRLLSVYFRG